MNTIFFKRLDDETLAKIADAHMDDLIERRGIKAPIFIKSVSDARLT